MAVPPPPVDQNNETIPQTWPGGFGLYKFSRRAVLNNWRAYMLLIIVMISLTVILDVAARTASAIEGTTGTAMWFTAQAASLMVSIVQSIMMAYILLKGVMGVKVTLGEAFSKIGTYFIPMLLQSILVTVIILVCAIPLLIPLFFVLPRLMLAGYFIVDKGMGPVEAIKSSWTATKGHVGKVYGIFGVMLLIALLCITIIGIPFALYFMLMYAAALPVLYHWIVRSNHTELASSPRDVELVKS